MVLVACAASLSVGLENTHKLRNEIFGVKAARKMEGGGGGKKRKEGERKEEKKFPIFPSPYQNTKKNPVPRSFSAPQSHGNSCYIGHSSWTGADDSYVNPLSRYL